MPSFHYSCYAPSFEGDRITIVQPVNIYGCHLSDDVFIGPFVEIQSNVYIGSRTKVQSHSFICSGVKIGSDCVVAHGVKFINDTFATGVPANGDESLWGATSIEARVYIGTNSTILPVSICSDVVIGAGSVVTKDIVNSGIYAGNPARLIRSLNP